MLLQQRKKPRLPAANYRGRRFYFVTICCFQRRKTFTRAAHCGWLLEFIQSEAAIKNFAVHAYFGHILRRPEEIQSVAWYIWLNPVRKGIASQPQAYAFAGSLTGLKMPSAWANLDWKPEWKREVGI